MKGERGDKPLFLARDWWKQKGRDGKNRCLGATEPDQYREKTMPTFKRAKRGGGGKLTPSGRP